MHLQQEQENRDAENSCEVILLLAASSQANQPHNCIQVALRVIKCTLSRNPKARITKSKIPQPMFLRVLAPLTFVANFLQGLAAVNRKEALKAGAKFDHKMISERKHILRVVAE